MKKIFAFSCIALSLFSACNSKDSSSAATSKTDSTKPSAVKASPDTSTINDASIDDVKAIMARKEVPILCYHHIKDDKVADYTVSSSIFRQEMKLLADSGYKTVLPNQLYNYLTHGTPIPAKSVMITFDDTDLEQFTIGKTEMDKYGFKGVYFIMTISIGRPRYMNKQQIKQLNDEGHAVECHTWDHHDVRKYAGNDWDMQLDKPRKTLEDIIGKHIVYFAYPFGAWNPAAFPELKKRGYKMAFILSTKRDSTAPLYTVRRMIVAGQWSANTMMRAMKISFH